MKSLNSLSHYLMPFSVHDFLTLYHEEDSEKKMFKKEWYIIKNIFLAKGLSLANLLAYGSIHLFLKLLFIIYVKRQP